MEKHNKCRECVNFLPIEGTVYGHCKVRPFAQKQGGWKTDKELLVTRSRDACQKDFIKVDKIPDVVRVCKRCGKEFTLSKNGNRVFCCNECRTKWHIEQKSRERAAAKQEKASAKRNATKKRKKPKVPLSEVMRMAAEERLSYGQIVQKYGL